MEQVAFCMKWINFFSILGTMGYTWLCARLLQYSLKEAFVCLLGLCGSFLVLRISYYDVFTPDVFGLFLSAGVLYHILRGRRVDVFLVAVYLLAAQFSNPIVGLLGAVLLILPRASSARFNAWPLFEKGVVAKYTPWLVLVAMTLWPVGVILQRLRLGKPLTMWEIPDEIDLWVFPVSVVAVGAFTWWLSKALWERVRHYGSPVVFRCLSFRWLRFFVVLAVFKNWLIQQNGRPIDLDNGGHLFSVWALYFTMKPLAGVSCQYSNEMAIGNPSACR